MQTFMLDPFPLTVLFFVDIVNGQLLNVEGGYSVT